MKDLKEIFDFLQQIPKWMGVLNMSPEKADMLQDIRRIIFEWKEYKDLEKQGKLVKLPCKVGQKVYIVGRNSTKPTIGEVASVRISAGTSSMRLYIPATKQHINRAFEQIGKSVFLAQAADGEALTKRGGIISADDVIVVNGKKYNKKELCLDWFRMSNNSFFQKYGFNFNPHEYTGLYDWGRKLIYGA